MRKGIVSDLSGVDGIRVVGQVPNRLELMDSIYRSNPDVVILGEDSSNGTGIADTINLIHQKPLNPKLLLITKQYDDDRELALLRMGVRGFLPESAGSADILKCVRAIGRGEMWVRRKVMEKLISQLLAVIHGLESGCYMVTSMPIFTTREMEIMMLVSRGCRNKEIGKNLHLSEKTIKHYVSKVFKKLHVKKRTDVRQYLGSFL
jgi:DNA-binding NarL/FixJ family response regulator